MSYLRSGVPFGSINIWLVPRALIWLAIPVELHTATHSQNVSFNLLHAKCGSRLKNRHLCPVCNEVVERHQLVRGYEIEKGRYVQGHRRRARSWADRESIV
jgi:non-homologous end joining protein Ku